MLSPPRGVALMFVKGFQDERKSKVDREGPGPHGGSRMAFNHQRNCQIYAGERTVGAKSHERGTFPVRWYLIGERDHVVDSMDLDEYLRKTQIAAGTAPLPPRAVKKLLEKEVSA
jgi:hypothetical protein